MKIKTIVLSSILILLVYGCTYIAQPPKVGYPLLNLDKDVYLLNETINVIFDAGKYDIFVNYPLYPFGMKYIYMFKFQDGQWMKLNIEMPFQGCYSSCVQGKFISGPCGSPIPPACSITRYIKDSWNQVYFIPEDIQCENVTYTDYTAEFAKPGKYKVLFEYYLDSQCNNKKIIEKEFKIRS